MSEVVIPLQVRDLIPEDLPSCAWSGSALHLVSVARELDRARRGEVDYLAACPPSGLPVAVGGIDYAGNPGAGTLYQLSVHPRCSHAGSAPSSSRPLSSTSSPAACVGPN